MSHPFWLFVFVAVTVLQIYGRFRDGDPRAKAKESYAYFRSLLDALDFGLFPMTETWTRRGDSVIYSSSAPDGAFSLRLVHSVRTMGIATPYVFTVRLGNAEEQTVLNSPLRWSDLIGRRTDPGTVNLRVKTLAELPDARKVQEFVRNLQFHAEKHQSKPHK